MKKNTRRIPFDEWCENMIPPGTSADTEMLILRGGTLIATVVSLFLFITRYFADYNRLFEVVSNVKVVKDSAVMVPFRDLTDGIFTVFWLIILCQLIFIGYHYAYFHMGQSKSIYLMRRLPDRWALCKRILTFPLTVIAFCFIGIIVLNFIYYTFYYICTPAVCLPQ